MTSCEQSRQTFKEKTTEMRKDVTASIESQKKKGRKERRKKGEIFSQEAAAESRRLLEGRSLTVGRWRRGAIGLGCRSGRRSLSWGWCLVVVVGRSEDVHAARWTCLLPLEPGAQAARSTTGRRAG